MTFSTEVRGAKASELNGSQNCALFAAILALIPFQSDSVIRLSQKRNGGSCMLMEFKLREARDVRNLIAHFFLFMYTFADAVTI